MNENYQMIDLSGFRNWQAPREMEKLRAVKGKAAREIRKAQFRPDENCSMWVHCCLFRVDNC